MRWGGGGGGFSSGGGQNNISTNSNLAEEIKLHFVLERGGDQFVLFTSWF